MKNMRLALILVLVISLLTLSSCHLLFGQVDDSGVFTVVVEAADGSYTDYKVELSALENNKEGAKGVIEYLKENNDGFYVEMIDSTYGAYVSAIGSIKESAADKMYVIVYTSMASDSYEGAPTVQYDGMTLYQAGIGLSGMQVSEGGIILFRLENSPY